MNKSKKYYVLTSLKYDPSANIVEVSVQLQEINQKNENSWNKELRS